MAPRKPPSTAIGRAAARWSSSAAAEQRDDPVGRLEAEVRDLKKKLAAEQTRRRELERLVEIDPLTELLNRRGLARMYAVAVAERERRGKPVGLILLDLDRFKEINDRLGHEAGDRALVAVGHLIRQSFRATDSVARLGGDEFAVLLPGTDRSDENIKLFRARLTHAFGQEPYAGILTGASIGMVITETGETLEAALARADGLMYDEKKSGREEKF